MSAMINFTEELPQNTTVIQSEHTEQYSKSSDDSTISRQSMISTMDNNGQQSAVLHASVMPFLTPNIRGDQIFYSVLDLY